MDLQRFISGEPVLAHPPTRGYKLRKFIRKNRRVVLAAALLLFVLLAGIAGTTWGMMNAMSSGLAARKASGEREEQRMIAVKISLVLSGILMNPFWPRPTVMVNLYCGMPKII